MEKECARWRYALDFEINFARQFLHSENCIQVNGQDSQAEIFDVFLCHKGEDKPAVREISKKLVKEGIKPWLDEEQIRPGTSWQPVLGEQIKKINSAAVFVGNSGIGPWQDEEIQALLSQFMKRKCPVIPTVLANATKTPELPWTLENRQFILRNL